MSDVMNSLVDGAGNPSSEGFEERVRKVRVRGAVIVVLAAASLVASMMEYAVPVTFVLTVFSFGGLGAVWISFRRRIDFGMLGAIVFGLFIGGWSFLDDLLFPTLSGNFTTTSWTGMSAWALGFGLFALPLVRFSFERKWKAIQAQQASVQRSRDRGDSAFVAGLRTSAGKIGKGQMITLIAIAAVMGGLGMYAWLFLDLRIGLLLALMMLPPIALFAWMLKLRGGG